MYFTINVRQLEFYFFNAAKIMDTHSIFEISIKFYKYNRLGGIQYNIGPKIEIHLCCIHFSTYSWLGTLYRCFNILFAVVLMLFDV